MMDLIDLRELYTESSDFAYLKQGNARYVPGRGSQRPVAMLLGETPGATDTLRGRPLAGRVGLVLHQLIQLAGLRTEDKMVVPVDVEDGEPEVSEYANAYITMMLKYQTPGNRAANQSEVYLSLLWVRKEWQILHRPPVIVTLGGAATRCILGEKFHSEMVIGSPNPIAAGGPTIWPMFHPKTAISKPEIRPVCEEGWQALGAWLKEEGLT